ncbi:hypothetical protein niasHT_006218 [Heterodera trifolii]|uniref:Secreted protein n=1 Tax=Heterodera trifolii TaxID=157864 RepID=A0ABD2M145_9BILA
MPIRQALGFQLLTGATHAHSPSPRVPTEHWCHACQFAKPSGSNCSRMPRMPIRQALGFQLLTVPLMPIRQALGFQPLTGATHAHSQSPRVPTEHWCHACQFAKPLGSTAHG